jgi:hypothetical protein
MLTDVWQRLGWALVCQKNQQGIMDESQISEQVWVSAPPSRFLIPEYLLA